MSKRVYKTANGRQINIDAIIAQNEESIAVGNMRVNARGDELGPGGKIEKTRDKVMADYYKLNTPIASDYVPTPREPARRDLTDDWIEPAQVQEETEAIDPETTATAKPLRGSLASAVAKNQTPTSTEVSKKSGPTRI